MALPHPLPPMFASALKAIHDRPKDVEYREHVLEQVRSWGLSAKDEKVLVNRVNAAAKGYLDTL